ncbi:DUF2807 domain-containing protein [Flavobacterium lutivivi]|jgi:hypothetical protein|nr:DUF2807 domain-containing protein [Flavobacterium lutivivi]
MKKLVFSILFLSSIAFGQIEKNVGDFTKITAFDQIDVYLEPSNENKVVIEGKYANQVELVNKNGELKIRMSLTKMLDGDDISVTVYFNELTAVEANEGSRIACGNLIKSNNFEIIAKEGSQIKLLLNVNRLTARTANGSTVSLEGNAKSQEVIVNSGGIYEAKNLKTSQTIITGNAGGEADIFATDFVDAKVRAGGTITIYGKPKQIDQKIIAGGSIEEAK